MHSVGRSKTSGCFASVLSSTMAWKGSALLCFALVVSSAPTHVICRCEQDVPTDEGFQWMRVRHIPGSNRAWHPAVDNLAGTQVYGTPTDDSTPWSVQFSSWDFEEFLFASGTCQKWLVMSRDALFVSPGVPRVHPPPGTNPPCSASQAYDVERSSRNPAKHSVPMFHRDVLVCGANLQEDPWISLGAHPDGLLYGEDSFSSTHLADMANDEGYDVYVKMAVIPVIANPLIPFYGYGAINPAPNPPTAGEVTTIEVVIGNDGDGDASGVEVKLSLNTWAVSFGGWQEIGTQTIDVLAAGQEKVLSFTNVFESEGHTCLEAKVLGVEAGGDADANDNRGQINMMVQHCEGDCDFSVPFTNGGDDTIAVTNVMVACLAEEDVLPTDPRELAKMPCEAAEVAVDKIELEAGGEKEVPIRFVKQIDKATPLLMVVQGTGPDGEINHVVVRLVPSTVETMLNEPMLCCLESIKNRVLLETLLADALDAYEAGECKRAIKLLRYFLQKAKILECDLTDEEKRCLLEAMRKVADIARMIARNCTDETAVKMGRTVAEGDYFARSGLLEAAVLEYSRLAQEIRKEVQDIKNDGR